MLTLAWWCESTACVCVHTFSYRFIFFPYFCIVALRFLSFGWSFFFRQSGKHTKFSNVVEFLVFIPDRHTEFEWSRTEFHGNRTVSCSSCLNGLKPLHLCILLKSSEPSHDKTNKMACAPSEDSDQPGNQPSLIRVFAVRMKKAWALSYPVSAERRLIRLGGCPGWSESRWAQSHF